jgi:hypothetical protein
MLDNGWLLIVFLAWLEGCFGFDCKGSELFWIVQVFLQSVPILE